MSAQLGWMRYSPSAVVTMDPDGRITSLNPAAMALLSTDGAAIGETYTTVFGPSLGARILPLFMRVARSKASADPQALEATLPGSGRRARLRASAGPLLEDGQLIGMIFAADDESAEAASAHAAAEHAEREQRLREALRRYTGDAVAAAVDARPSFVQIGGTRRTITCMHSDVRGYTTLAEALEPEKVTELLIRYHGAAVRALREAGGMIDRFIGDAILALWNAPADQPGHVRMAIQGALAMQRATGDVGSDLRYGAGVHTGPAVVGNLGSDEYMNYTAIGDTVNVAARLQSAAGKGEVICSRAALDEAGPGVRTTALGPLSVKGRQAPVEAFRVEGIDA